MLRKLLIAGGFVTVGGGAGGYFVYQRRLQENRAITAADFNAKQDQEQLKVAFTAIKNHKDIPEILFFRYTTCPFCGKVKSFLDYFEIPHTPVEVEPMFKGQIATSEYKKVPQLRFNVSGHYGPYLVDSDEIINALAPLVGAGKDLTDPDVMKWREWARSALVRHLVVNINSTLQDAWEGYSYIDNFDTIPWANKMFLKVMGAPVMYLVAKYKTLPALKQSGELKDGDDFRQVLRSQVNSWVTVGLKNASKGPFHGGKKPDLADIDVYGVLQSVRGHRLYDDLYEHAAAKAWLDQMDAAMKKTPYAPSKMQVASRADGRG